MEAGYAVGLFLLNRFKISSSFKQYDNQQPQRKSELVTAAVNFYTGGKRTKSGWQSLFIFFLLKGLMEICISTVGRANTRFKFAH